MKSLDKFPQVMMNGLLVIETNLSSTLPSLEVPNFFENNLRKKISDFIEASIYRFWCLEKAFQFH